MKKKDILSKLALLALCAGITFGSCSSEEDDSLPTSATGTLTFAVKNGALFNTGVTRTLNENDYKNTDNYTVQIIDDKNQVLKEDTYANLKTTSFKLSNGNYTVKAYYGEESNASQDKFLVTGSTAVSVAANDQQVSVDCYPTCGKLQANFDASMANYFTAWSATYETEALTAAGSALNWTQTNTAPWYVKLNPKGETVKATIYITRDGTTSQVVKTCEGMKPNQSWTMNIAPKDDNGTLWLEITIDESTDDTVHEIEVPSDWI